MDKIKKREYIKKHRKLYPWVYTLMAIKSRCNNKNVKCYKYYGGRGIKCLITKEELKELWFRDKAYLMDKPSIDRNESDKDYTFNNCKYIEMTKNIIKDKTKSILQFDLQGNFIKEWESASVAGRELNISQPDICYCALKKEKEGYVKKTAGGYKWRYKNG